MTEEEHKDYIAGIFLLHAGESFGQMLGFLCEKAMFSQSELGRRATKYREYLRENGYLMPESNTKAVDQTGISRVIRAEKEPSYAQIYIWFHILKERFNDQGYKAMCAMIEEEPFVFTQEFEDEMWYLAKYAPPRKVVSSYKKHEGIIY